jgi:hypothetical protein
MATSILPTTFGERLKEILASEDITDFDQQVAKIASVCEVTPRTAKKYLKLDKCPERLPIGNLCSAFKCDYEWVYNGGGIPFALSMLLEVMKEWNEKEKDKFYVYLKGWTEDDPKMLEVFNKLKAGQLTRTEFFAAI